jgi:hypothetical protein
MPRFIVERTIVGACDLTRDALLEIGRRSKRALSGMDVPYSGVETYVDGDRICCIHSAENAEIIYQRAREAGFPADLVIEIEPSGNPGIPSGVLSQLQEEFGVPAQVRCTSGR